MRDEREVKPEFYIVKPVYKQKHDPFRLSNAAVLTCSVCNNFISDAGGCIEGAICPACYAKLITGQPA